MSEKDHIVPHTTSLSRAMFLEFFVDFSFPALSSLLMNQKVTSLNAIVSVRMAVSFL